MLTAQVSRRGAHCLQSCVLAADFSCSFPTRHRSLICLPLNICTGANLPKNLSHKHCIHPFLWSVTSVKSGKAAPPDGANTPTDIHSGFVNITWHNMTSDENMRCQSWNNVVQPVGPLLEYHVTLVFNVCFGFCRHNLWRRFWGSFSFAYIQPCSKLSL